ncbi:MAG: hypothetical protein ACFFCT_01370 [Candidatus Odinarchaeota archaeon]
MATNILNQELVDAIQVFMTPKFMVTKDSNNEPNVALVMTWTIYDENRLVYGDFMTVKSRENLINGNQKMSILVFTLGLDSWLIRAEFESFHRNDDVYEFMAQTPLFKYNQYTNARAAGVAEAISASQKYSISKLAVLRSFIKAQLAKRGVPIEETYEGNMPKNIYDAFSKMAAVKVLAFIDADGYPVAFPEFGMLPVSSNTIVVKRKEEKKRRLHLHEGQRVAISLVTLEPAAFQLKGVFHEINNSTGYICCDKVYACSLPRPGVRVDIPILIPE